MTTITPAQDQTVYLAHEGSLRPMTGELRRPTLVVDDTDREAAEMTSASPRIMKLDASVAMNELMRPTVTTVPLNIPAPRPARQPSSSPSAALSSSSAILAAITEQRA